MPTNDRPLRDVLREVEEYDTQGQLLMDEWRTNARRLAREIRSIAPLLREAARELARHMHPNDRVLLDKLNAKADELEAKP